MVFSLQLTHAVDIVLFAVDVSKRKSRLLSATREETAQTCKSGWSTLFMNTIYVHEGVVLTFMCNVGLDQN